VQSRHGFDLLMAIDLAKCEERPLTLKDY